MDLDSCIEAVQEAIARRERPAIFNTDQGIQFTSRAFTQMLEDNKIAISMDRKVSWRDNVCVERLWRLVRCEEVYLKAYENVTHARQSLGKYLDCYRN